MKAINCKILFYLVAICLSSFYFYSCKEQEEIDAGEYSCKTLPAFIKNTGLNPGRTALSTSEKHTMGMVLKEFPLPNSNTLPKIYQHPSWKTAGWLSPIQIDKFGNVFTASAPFISVLDNPVQKQNTIYIINSTDGIMKEFMQLPQPDSNDHRNPFGILSIAFNCKKNILYVSSVAGSTAEKEMGCIYAIDIEKKKIIDQLEGNDFFGIQVVVADGKLLLLAGSTRNSGIYSIKINNNGTFGNSPEKVSGIEGLGLRGDDKVKKIIFKSEDVIQVKGLDFNYNLIAPTEKQESSYDFNFDLESKKWILKK